MTSENVCHNSAPDMNAAAVSRAQLLACRLMHLNNECFLTWVCGASYSWVFGSEFMSAKFVAARA